jgi:hypothetical protein
MSTAIVMARLVRAIQFLSSNSVWPIKLDGPHKAGHDDEERCFEE